MKTIAKKNIDWANSIAYWLSRPYVLLLAMAFIFTPLPHMASALESGADFLNIEMGAKPGAMGSAYTAMSNDINSIYYNTAGLAFMNKRELSFMHADGMMDNSYDFAAMAFPIKDFKAAFSFAKFSHGTFDTRSANRSSAGNFDASDMVMSFALARKITGSSGIGLGIKFLSSNIANYSANALAFDMGINHRIDSQLPLALGISVRNLGYGMKFINERENLPLSINAGAALGIMSAINLSMDIKRMVYDKKTFLSFGTEYNVMGGLSLRGGYSSMALDGGSQDIAGSISGGIGLKTANNMTVDYSFTPMGEFETVNKLSLSYNF
ncbi:MAG: PorV/PorQ family protein [Elusimicrobiales bacterium]|nr:PorV/PorQ family protein [Elusimicrobiales bacterium]